MFVENRDFINIFTYFEHGGNKGSVMRFKLSQ